MVHYSYPSSLKPSAAPSWYDELSSKRMKNERMRSPSRFASSSLQLEYRDSQALRGGKFRSITYEDTRDDTEHSYRQTIEGRDEPGNSDMSDVGCYLYGVDQQLVSPPRLTRSSMADNPSYIARKKTNNLPQVYPLQTRHTKSKNIKHENCRPIVPIYDHSYIGQPKFCIHRLRLPTQFLPILDRIVEGCERYAGTLPHGWSTDLYSLTKQDVALAKIPQLYEIARPVVSYVKRVAAQIYKMRSLRVDRNQPHVLKYSGNHKGVELHHDRSDVTINIMLSRSHTYTGGGTYFRDVNQNVRLEFGEFLLHTGDAVHGGTPIKDGTRYLMVIFADEKL